MTAIEITGLAYSTAFVGRIICMVQKLSRVESSRAAQQFPAAIPLSCE